jgi:aspartyl protease family protein
VLVNAIQAVTESTASEVLGKVPGTFAWCMAKNQNFFHVTILSSIVRFRNLISISARGRLLLSLGLLIAAHPVGAVEKISLHALFKDKAIVLVDGARRVLKTGDTSPEGVKLVSTDTQEEKAEIEVDGKRQELKLGVVVSSFVSTGKGSVTLYPDRGHFFTDGLINGVAVRFLVDTGASTVTMNGTTATRIGLDYRKTGQRAFAETAGGVVRKYVFKLNQVQIGDITLHNVDGGVIEDMQSTFVLLGMSFLGQLDMKRDGEKMELTQRY